MKIDFCIFTRVIQKNEEQSNIFFLFIEQIRKHDFHTSYILSKIKLFRFFLQKNLNSDLQSINLLLLLLSLILSSSIKSRRRSSNSLVSSRSIFNNLQVNSGRNRVVLLVADLGNSPGFTSLNVNVGVAQISDGSGFAHVSDDHFGDGFVLGDSGGGGFASDEFDVSSAFFVSSVVSALFSHVWMLGVRFL